MRKNYLFPTFILILLLLSYIIPVNSKLDEPSYDYELVCSDETITTLMSSRFIKSLTFAVVNESGIIYEDSFGEQNDTSLAYYIGEISSTFTAVAVLQLFERGLIKLNDSINDYLPYDIIHPYYPESNITFENLLTHTSGLVADENLKYSTYNNLIYSGNYSNFSNKSSSYPNYISEYLTFNGTYFSNNTWNENVYPGQYSFNVQYSNIGFTLLGYLVEQISNQTYNEYLRENIFQPLGMNNTSTLISDFANGTIVNTYLDKFAQNSSNPIQINEMGALGIISTSSDMANYLIAHIKNGEFNGSRILQDENMRLMHSQKIHNRYGYAWQLNKLRPYFSGYEGEVINSDAGIMYNNNTNVGVFVAVNYMNQYKSLNYISNQLYNYGINQEKIGCYNKTITIPADIFLADLGFYLSVFFIMFFPITLIGFLIFKKKSDLF